jgi:hypothetical protein
MPPLYYIASENRRCAFLINGKVHVAPTIRVGIPNGSVSVACGPVETTCTDFFKAISKLKQRAFGSPKAS